MSEKFQKFLLSVFGVLTMSILVSYLVFAWTEPSQSPPQGNVPAPINVGPQGQAKEGGLILNTGGAQYGLIVANGRVGIGTSTTNSITNTLHVFGNFAVEKREPGGTGWIQIVPSSADVSLVVKIGEALRFGFANNFDGSGFTEAMRINQDKNVGIGTTGPSARLHVFGDTSNTRTVLINIGTTASTFFPLDVRSNDSSIFSVRANGIVRIENPSYHNSAIQLEPQSTFQRIAFNQLRFYDKSDMVTFNNGNVGIGTTTPDYKLHILGDVMIDNGVLRWQNTNPQIVTAWDTMDIYLDTDNTTVADVFRIWHNGPPGSATNLLTISHNGNVGIGTTNPVQRLTVAGNIVGGDPTRRMDISSGNLFSNSWTGLEMWGDDPTRAGEMMIYGRYISFRPGKTSPTSNPSEAVRIDSSGNVGIGTITPQYKLHVIGDVKIEGNFVATGEKSAIVETSSFGKRKLYAIEAPTVRFIDEGEGKLVNGEAKIYLDPMFVEAIEGEILVHLTPRGPVNIYVAEQKENYFVVKSFDGRDVEFNWMVSAFRKGYKNVRMEKAE
jgi:hypothetical protein